MFWYVNIKGGYPKIPLDLIGYFHDTLLKVCDNNFFKVASFKIEVLEWDYSKNEYGNITELLASSHPEKVFRLIDISMYDVKRNCVSISLHNSQVSINCDADEELQEDIIVTEIWGAVQDPTEAFLLQFGAAFELPRPVPSKCKKILVTLIRELLVASFGALMATVFTRMLSS